MTRIKISAGTLTAFTELDSLPVWLRDIQGLLEIGHTITLTPPEKENKDEPPMMTKLEHDQAKPGDRRGDFIKVDDVEWGPDVWAKWLNVRTGELVHFEDVK